MSFAPGTPGTCLRREQAQGGFRLVSPAEGTGTGPILISCTRVVVHGQTCVAHTPSAPQPPHRRFAPARVAQCREETAFFVRNQAGSLVVMAARGADGGTASARRRRERRQRSWWRHQQLSVAAAVATALHHSAQGPAAVVEEPREVEEHVTYDSLRGQKAPPPGDAAGASA